MPGSTRFVSLGFFLGLFAAVSACGRGNAGKIGVSVNPDVIEAANRQNAAKDTSACLDPREVRAGKEYTCADGTKRKGLFLAESLPACRQDGETACVASAAYAAAATTALASKVLAGQTVAGVAGGAAIRPADCGVDGGTGCVSTPGFPAANVTLLSPGNIKKNAVIAGITGDYPSATYALAGATVATDLTSLAASTASGSYEFFDSAGTQYSGSITDAGSILIGISAQTFNTSLYRQFTVPGDANLVAASIANGVSVLGVTGTAAVRPSDCAADGGTNCVSVAGFTAANTTGLPSKVLSGQTVAGVAGNITLPAVLAVRTTATFGVNNATSGTLADCTTDGQTNCTIPTSTTIKAADTANFVGWDIRKKLNSAGTVLTFAGLAGQSKTCRNRANRTVFENTTAPANTSAGLDFFDTIDDYNNNLTGLPGEIPAWTMLIGGNTVTAGNDFACGGIYATGGTATGNTGADASLAHNADGNWQDLTPGIRPGGANSSNIANGCNATDKHCVFKELISDLMVTEVSGAVYTWQDALTYCNNLGEAGGVVTSPIPAIGPASYSDWRLPTQKELMQLYHAGIRGLNQTANLTTNFGDVDTWFWSSSSVSYYTSDAWGVYLDGGGTFNNAKAGTFRSVCVR